MQDLIDKIEAWAETRNLIKGSTPLDQSLKLFSEAGELADAIAKDDVTLVKDGIGDVFVVCVIISKQINQSLQVGYDSSLDNLKPKKYVIGLNHAVTLFAYNADRIYDGVVNGSKLDADIILMSLNRIATAYGLTLEDCIEYAYNDIKDRRGIMYEGVFIKSDDPRYAELGGV